jgi:hypothetical protein
VRLGWGSSGLQEGGGDGDGDDARRGGCDVRRGRTKSQTMFYLGASRRGAIYRIFTATRSSFLGRFCRPDSVKQCMWTGPRIKRMAHHYSVPYLNTFLKACLARWSSDCRNIKSETPNLELFVWDYSHFGTFSLYSLQEIHSILNTGVSCAWRKKKRGGRRRRKSSTQVSGDWGICPRSSRARRNNLLPPHYFAVPRDKCHAFV